MSNRDQIVKKHIKQELISEGLTFDKIPTETTVVPTRAPLTPAERAARLDAAAKIIIDHWLNATSQQLTNDAEIDLTHISDEALAELDDLIDMARNGTPGEVGSATAELIKLGFHEPSGSTVGGNSESLSSLHQALLDLKAQRAANIESRKFGLDQI